MPVPWSRSGAPVRIANVAERAITVNQLREMRTLLQRLTKVGLLKNTTEFSKSLGTFGQTIDWFHINMYQITDEVIKKVIPCLDPDGEHDPEGGGRRWYSWVEFVARKPQKAKVMMSHWWGGRFNDFTTAIDRLVEDKSFSINTEIWICTFANCQFGEDFGAMLEESPFVRVLGVTDITVHVVDRVSGSLYRSWCGLEIQHTVQNEAEFLLYTCAGRIGSSYVSGGPIVESVKTWDIRRSEASDPPYRRQILNYIAGVDELAGLKKTSSGALDVDSMKRPQLECSERDPKAPARINGQAEFAHESSLFQTHGKMFEDLNMMVRLSVMKNIDVGRRAKGCKLSSMAERGVTISQVRTFTAKLKASTETCPWWKGEFPEGPVHYEALTPSMVVNYVKHLTKGKSCSYMELVSNSSQIPQHFFEFAWGECWSDIMSSLEWYIEASHLPDSAVFFIDLLSADYHNTDAAIRRIEAKAALDEAHGFVRILSDNEENMMRAWPLHNMEFASRAGKDVFIACNTGAMACSNPFPNGSWVSGCFGAEIARRFSLVDARLGKCRNPDDMRIIEEFFNKACVHDGVDDGFSRFNARKLLWCAGPMLLHAAAIDDVDTIVSLSSVDGLRLNGVSLKGGLGETALHVAAGCCSLGALRALLDGKMDPNIEDSIGERPLHCAAMGGHAEAVRMLLSARADVRCESSFAEVPIQVAHQNPAVFLGIDTAEVISVLKEAWMNHNCGTSAITAKVSKAEKLREEVETVRAGSPQEE
mmetsp:Transcript_67728/g.144927  ORF Transcript_67728/g.144927 Transcript_67728/m.144927 type:complete len:760 (+) Transcript_67728:47-2326(+)